MDGRSRAAVSVIAVQSGFAAEMSPRCTTGATDASSKRYKKCYVPILGTYDTSATMAWYTPTPIES